MKNLAKLLCLLLVLSLCLGLAACGEKKDDAAADADASQETPAGAEDTAAADKAAADEVAALIDAIYVQTRTEETDAQCLAAKAAWDALTDAQKALVEGENADPDYFGRDTGDASKDNPLNDDGIGFNEILVVSFGTSFNDSRAEDIKGIEDAIAKAFPEWSVRRAFTAQIIINHVQARDGEKIDNMNQAMERAVANGVKNLVILPTHLMHGAEYDELMDVVEEYGDKIDNIKVAEPLLGPVGASATEINADKQAVSEVLVEAAVKDAGFASMKDAENAGVAFVFMGHGTSHNAKVSYTQMQTQMEKLGYKNAFIGTVEGEPESTSCEAVIEACKEAGFKKVILRPLMVVAGDHANNDMAGPDEDSWLSMFDTYGSFEAVETQIAGLGRLSGSQEIYVSHAEAAVGEANKAAADACAELIDAIYVQTRTEETDEQCAAAKAAWDALTDEAKELVEGDEADPDYFGRDTGDASLDDPRNTDGIGKNEILVVSFGTSFNDSRAQDIKGIEDAVAAAFPDWSVRRAFTAQIIINHVQARENEFIDNMEQAMERAVANGVQNLIILPTHLMHGAEYDELMEVVEEYADIIAHIEVAEPLLGPVGSTATEINADKQAVAEVLAAAAVEDAGFASMKEASDAGVAFVFMGHGTSHNAKVTYTQMQAQMEKLGYKNAFIGTVEGEPESTSAEAVIEACKDAGYTKIILRPLMVVAGDHANNDMAGEDEDSWKSMFEAAGCFESVEAQIAGLGRLSGIEELYIKHVEDVASKF